MKNISIYVLLFVKLYFILVIFCLYNYILDFKNMPCQKNQI